MQYRVLVIPGASDGYGGKLDLDGEIALLLEIADRYDTIDVDIVLTEEATEVGIASRLSLGGIVYDAAHWLGHADDGGFYLPNGEQLSQERIQRICVDAGARMVFLNSCESGRIGQYLVNNKIAVALSYAVPVMDKDGILNSLRFYTALARSNDPFEDGLREAYTAADPGDGSLLWLTNGAYVQEIIKPLMERLDQIDSNHHESFSAFNQVIGTTKNVVQDIDNRLSSQIARLASNTKHTRYALISLIGIILVSTFALGWFISSVRISSAHAFATATVEEPVTPTWELTPTWTPKVPPKNTHGATPQKPTSTRDGTIPPVPTDTQTPTEQATSVPTSAPWPTAMPSQTSTREATHTPTDTPMPQKAPTPTTTGTATALHTPTDWPTVLVPPLVTSTPTLTALELAVRNAVEATLSAGGCDCQ